MKYWSFSIARGLNGHAKQTLSASAAINILFSNFSTGGRFCLFPLPLIHPRSVVQVIQASAVTGYTRGSYSIRGPGAAKARPMRDITTQCIS